MSRSTTSDAATARIRTGESPDCTAPAAAEALVSRARCRLATRLDWLEADAAANGSDRPEDERAWIEARDVEDRRREVEAMLDGDAGVAWVRLVRTFALNEAEADLLALALAVGIEPALGPLVSRAQRSPSRYLPSESLVKRLHGHGARPIWRATSPLAMWHLVRPVAGVVGEPTVFEADPVLIDWMFGTISIDSALLLAVERQQVGIVPPEWPVEASARRLARVLETGSPARVLVEGAPRTGRRTFGAALARRLGREAVVLDPAEIDEGAGRDAFVRAQRFAHFADVALVWAAVPRAWPARVPMAPLQVVCVDPGGDGNEPCAEVEGCIDLRVRLPEPGLAARAGILRQLAPGLGADAERLAATPGVTLRDLEQVGRSAPESVEEAAATLRARSRTRIRGTGRVVDPRFDWDDLVVGEALGERLRRIAFEVRARGRLMEDAEVARQYAGASSLAALFHGPPGVGKSMAAEVVASELGVNLLVVDVAATTSKYIGETAKNLSAAFEQARTAGAALIFEEADAFFARRTDIKDSNDRHANADTNHLLQLLEGHEGLVVLSTNRRASIDPAFIRRLRHVVEFPRPDASQRGVLWGRLVASLDDGRGTLAAAVPELAARHDLSHAQIKGAVLSARYDALAGERAVTAADLEAGAARELSKEGRPAPTAAVRDAARRKERMARHG